MTRCRCGLARLDPSPTPGKAPGAPARLARPTGTTASDNNLPSAPRSETYEYYSLPYCQPKDGVKHKLLGMGEVVDANRMASTPYQLQFRKNRQREAVCEQLLDQEKLAKFRKVRGFALRGPAGA